MISTSIAFRLCLAHQLHRVQEGTNHVSKFLDNNPRRERITGMKNNHLEQFDSIYCIFALHHPLYSMIHPKAASLIQITRHFLCKIKSGINGRPLK